MNIAQLGKMTGEKTASYGALATGAMNLGSKALNYGSKALNFGAKAAPMVKHAPKINTAVRGATTAAKPGMMGRIGGWMGRNPIKTTAGAAGLATYAGNRMYNSGGGGGQQDQQGMTPWQRDAQSLQGNMDTITGGKGNFGNIMQGTAGTGSAAYNNQFRNQPAGQMGPQGQQGAQGPSGAPWQDPRALQTGLRTGQPTSPAQAGQQTGSHAPSSEYHTYDSSSNLDGALGYVGAATAATPLGMALGPGAEAVGWMRNGVPTKGDISDRSNPNSFISQYQVDKNTPFWEGAKRIGGAVAPHRWLSGMKNVYHQTIGKDIDRWRAS
jgi:hypothetical protein